MKKIISIAVLIIVSTSCAEKIKSVKPDTKDEITITEKPQPSIKKNEYEPYDFDTILKNGYNLSYRIYLDSENDTMQSLTLVKNRIDIRELNETSYPMLHKNLGYIGADFSNCFLFVQSYGSGNPTEFQLIEKETGKEMKSGVLVDANEENEIVLYISDIHTKKEYLKIYEVKNKTELIVNDFKNSKCYKDSPEGLRSCVTIASVTKNEIILKIDTEDEKITKTYKRSSFK